MEEEGVDEPLRLEAGSPDSLAASPVKGARLLQILFVRIGPADDGPVPLDHTHTREQVSSIRVRQEGALTEEETSCGKKGCQLTSLQVCV